MTSRVFRPAAVSAVALTLLLSAGAPVSLAHAASLDAEPALAEGVPAVHPLAAIVKAAPATAAEAELEQVRALAQQKQAEAQALRVNKTLAYDPALIAAIGNQSAGGHTICCPGYACAYGDAILTGLANSHANYGCGCCTWPGWGGGDSSFRSLGTNEALLREAYDQIAAGRPTVVHVAGAYGEHWICLMGYQNVEDPDNLTLDNFRALDPSDGAEITASSRYVLYGDACEHVSDLA